ncbi:hypothetical protein R1sor_019336 [Riccia sorocarpa]|uniref:Uncharacterized protein n=1 Tax=Riccia sorocarpa TaxID=122646 RepID=A0ABD3IIF1_9MARC
MKADDARPMAMTKEGRRATERVVSGRTEDEGAATTTKAREEDDGRDWSVKDRKKYNTVTTALRDSTGFPVWAHRLWSCKSAPPFTPFGTLLEGNDGYYRGTERREKSDLVILLETWEHRENTGIELPGFVRLESVWNPKRGYKGRGFGGIIAWTRETLKLPISVEYVDVKKQFLCLRLPSLPSPSFLVVAYFAAYGARIYSGQEEDNPFVEISKVILRLQE